jgi:tight adherence protein B
VIVLLPIVVALATFGVAAYAFERRSAVDPGRRIAAYVEPRMVALPGHDDELRRARFQRPLAVSERQLRRLPGWGRLETLVAQADMRLRPAELFYATSGGVLLVVLLGLVLGVSAFAVAVLAVLALFGLRVYLALRIDRRRHAFEQQLPELLTSLGSALRAGHGFTQALQAVAADAPEPAAKELQRVLTEARLGRSLEDALTDLGGRIGSQDFDFVLDAIIVQRQVGGSLAGIFEIVGESVRQRQQFALKLRALTAMGRMSATVLLALPFLLAVVLSLMNHAYLAPLFTTPIGRTLVVLSTGLLLVGALWLRLIVSNKG